MLRAERFAEMSKDFPDVVWIAAYFAQKPIHVPGAFTRLQTTHTVCTNGDMQFSRVRLTDDSKLATDVTEWRPVQGRVPPLTLHQLG